MTTSNNELPIELQPSGDICVPVSVPNDTQWLWLLAKCVSFPTHRRFWKNGIEADIKLMMAEWESRVYSPLIERILARDLCIEGELDNCIDYPPNHSIITYAPQNPFSQIGFVPEGYELPPFTRFQDILPDFIPDWLADLILDATGLFTGYEDNDVLTLIGSFPLLAGWDDILENGLPRFQVDVTGKGTLQIHFLNVPFGGRALISVDTEFDPADIISGIIEGGFRLIELERDFSSIPPELAVEYIEEIEIDTTGEHTIYVTFLPVIDATLIPFRFGGGVRSVTWCGEDAMGEVPYCDIQTIIDDPTFYEEQYQPAIFGDWYTETQSHNEELADDYNGTPQSIGANIPTGAPNAEKRNALCYSLRVWLELYASAKVCTIQSANFLQIGWNRVIDAANDIWTDFFTRFPDNMSPNLYSCFTGYADALVALADTSAIEDLACFIYDEIKGFAMSQSHFDDAIDEAATSMTGHAQDIACLLTADNNQTIYISFLETYSLKIAQNTIFDCPCDPYAPTPIIVTPCYGGGSAGTSITQISANRWRVTSTHRSVPDESITLSANSTPFRMSNINYISGAPLVASFFGWRISGDICRVGATLPNLVTNNMLEVGFVWGNGTGVHVIEFNMLPPL